MVTMAGDKAKGSKKKPAAQDKDSAVAAEEPPAKRQKKQKPDGPYTGFKDAGSIPEPVLTRASVPKGRHRFAAVSWNVGGLRGFMKSRLTDLQEVVRRENPDVIGLSEHKLQEDNTEDTMAALLEGLPDYEVGIINCSTAKKGYSGTAVLLRKNAPKPQKVTAEDLPSAQKEGRLVVVEYEKLFVVVVYVPNAGEGLKRLDERVGKWDAQLRDRLKVLAASKAVLVVGDLNVAHRDVDIWNVEAPHVPKSAGTTKEERESFSELLASGFVDGFAQSHGEALGAFTYWSIRAGNRKTNRGLRLDYALVSESMLSASSKGPHFVEAFHLPDLAPGDHCPVGAVLAL